MDSFKVTRTWRYEDDKGRNADSVILVDGQKIGGVYQGTGNPAQTVGWGTDDGGKRGVNWISWGPRGLSCGHRSRTAAEQAQVRQYVTNPDLYDRYFAQERREAEARQALAALARDHTRTARTAS